jgi:hypothetical protein
LATSYVRLRDLAENAERVLDQCQVSSLIDIRKGCARERATYGEREQAAADQSPILSMFMLAPTAGANTTSNRTPELLRSVITSPPAKSSVV